MDDSDVELSIELCKLLGIKVIIRGTDDDPKVIMKCRWTLKPIGGLELRQRMRRFRGADLIAKKDGTNG